jgi:LacI family gluconate utilization system Gnt-I transcriptional repressor
VVGVTDYDLEKEQSLVISMMSWRPAAVIVPNSVHTERTTNILRRTGIPVVEMMSLSPDPIDINIGIDQRAAARDLAHYVLSKGHQRFAFLGWNEKDAAALDRFREIERVIRERDLVVVPPHLYSSPPNFLRGKAGIKALLDMHKDLDAVFFPNDTTAIGGMMHCFEKGIRIPDDIALVGYSGLAMGQNMPVQLTTVETKRFETGQMAAKKVLARLAGRRSSRVHDMGYVLLPGQTV